MNQSSLNTFKSSSGFYALFYKEVKRFWRVSFQTVAAPVLTAILYLMIFGHVLEDHVKVYDAIGYTAFLIPGLVMMSLLQNSFANTSSSLIQSKITGNLIFVLLAPLSHFEFFSAYVLAAMVRGVVVGAGVFLATCWFTDISFYQPLWILVFGLLSAALLAALGLIAGIWAEKFDQLAAFQNFFIMPATMLSGVFYSIHSLPPIWQTISRTRRHNLLQTQIQSRSCLLSFISIPSTTSTSAYQRLDRPHSTAILPFHPSNPTRTLY